MAETYLPTDFRLDSTRYCLFCLKQLHKNKGTLLIDPNHKLIQQLFHYLKIPIGNISFEGKETGDLTLTFCDSCKIVMKRLSKLLLNLEAIQIEVDYHLETINKRIADSNRNPVISSSNSSNLVTANFKESTELNIEDNLRKQVLTKSKLMQRNPQPTVNITKSKVLKVHKVIKTENDDLDTSEYCEDDNFPLKIDEDHLIDSPHEEEHLSDYPEDFKDNSPPDIPPVSCPLSQLSSEEISKIKMFTLNAESRKYACTACDKTFNRSRSAKYHYLIVHLQQKFECDKCKEIYTRKDHLKRHQQTYCKGNPDSSNTAKRKLYGHKCNSCNKLFSSKPNLMKHVNRVHRMVRNYVCDKCGKEYKSNTNLAYHLKINKCHNFSNSNL